MKRILMLFIISLVFLNVTAQDSLRGLIFSAIFDTIEGSSETESIARGVAAFSYHDDTLHFDITINGLTSNLTGATLQSSVDSVKILLDDFIDRNSIKGAISSYSFGDSLITNLLNGDAIVVIHTTNNPDGELLGNIKAEADINFGAMLDMEQAGNTEPPILEPSGLSSFNISQDSSKLEVNVLVNQLTSAITNAHLHYGAPGVSGPPVVSLMEYNEGNSFRGVFDLDSLVDRNAFFDSLSMGHIYVNIHTANYPAGEIRGQLAEHEVLSFDTWLDISQETDTVDPATPDSAMALAHITFNSLTDSMSIHVQADNLTGVITGAHFHLGTTGVSGPVAVPLTDSVSGNLIMATLTPDSPEFSGDLNYTSFITEALNGNIYINLHTELNPGGEVRGQVMSLARRGVIYSLCALQEEGTVTGGDNAQGSGFISMDRMGTNLHYGMAVAELSSTLTGAHFHDGLPGVNGPVIHALPTDSVVSGYWNDSTFTSDVALNIANGGVYANFHTTINPAGEVRGQVAWGDWCRVPVGIINPELQNSYSVSIFPNPLKSTATISYSLSKQADVSIRIYNVVGKEISSLPATFKPAGTYNQTFDASGLQNGMYIFRLVVDGTSVYTGKIMVNR